MAKQKRQLDCLARTAWRMAHLKTVLCCTSRTEGFTFELTQTGEGKGSSEGGEGGGKPVVRDHPSTGLPQIRTIEFSASASSHEALLAYEKLQQVMADEVGFGVELGLDGNDLLLLNNRSAVHGRVGFRANYDGADRWLQRHSA